MQTDPTYSFGSMAEFNQIGEDPLDAMCRARTIMRQGREAALHLAKLGLIRPKTEEEVKQDLASMPKQKRLKGRPPGEVDPFLDEETRDAFDRYKQGTPAKFLAQDMGISTNALRQRWNKRGLKKL